MTIAVAICSLTVMTLMHGNRVVDMRIPERQEQDADVEPGEQIQPPWVDPRAQDLAVVAQKQPEDARAGQQEPSQGEHPGGPAALAGDVHPAPADFGHDAGDERILLRRSRMITSSRRPTVSPALETRGRLSNTDRCITVTCPGARACRCRCTSGDQPEQPADHRARAPAGPARRRGRHRGRVSRRLGDLRVWKVKDRAP